MTLNPPETAWSSVTVKVIASPSAALASAIVTAGADTVILNVAVFGAHPVAPSWSALIVTV